MTRTSASSSDQLPQGGGDQDAIPPVALFIFNRPDTTARVLARLAEVRPPQLLVVADGPRAGREGEAELCAQTRALLDRIDWPCEVRRNFSDVNLGCKRRVSSGLDWVFSLAESAIILEDDCLPDPSFFPFCRELLARYKDDERVAMISGDNFQPHADGDAPFSYYFSRYPHVWGWASWRRTWRNYDVSLSLWPAVRERRLLDDIVGERTAEAWTKIFDAVYAGEIDTWDYQFTFLCWMQNGLSILPQKNLVSNVGFGSDATHTVDPSDLANLPAYPMAFPLRHPPYMVRDAGADARTEAVFGTPDLLTRVRNKVRKSISVLRQRVGAGGRAS